MVHTLPPREAEALIAAGDIDIVDVRDPGEFADGHVPGARNVPLGVLKSKAKAELTKNRVLFVCARGMRSMTAAEIAEAAGLTEIYSMEGGTVAWQDAGLPTEEPARAKSETKTASAAPQNAVSCGLPEPGLDAVVGTNMRELRTQKGMSLDALAQTTGLSRTLLGQIELGKTPPSVSVVWRIAQAFDVHFSALLATNERFDTTVLRGADAKRLVSPDGRYSSRALYPLAEKPDAEFYELFLAGHSREDAEPHKPGTRENLIVTSGRLDLVIDGTRHELKKGDAIVFTADVPHSYVNPGNEECWMYLVMTYAPGARAGQASSG